MSKIKILGEKKIYNGEYLDLYEKSISTDNGNYVYEFTKRKYKNIVAVLVLTTGNELVLIRNFRIPLEKYVLEIPAGVGDVLGETIVDVAKREMLEETGYISEEMEFLGYVPTSAGMTNEIVSFFVARNSICKSKKLELDDLEDIYIEKVPLSNLEFFLDNEMKIGNMVDSKIFYVFKYLL